MKLKKSQPEPKKRNPNTALNVPAQSLAVAGIGASAGGLDAFKKLLPAIPERSGIAYVLVQHLDPNHQSKLPGLLQKITKIPVLEIIDDIKIEADHIYVLPGNKMLTVKGDKLKLLDRSPKSKIPTNETIDIFFTSLAQAYEGHAIGIVLSGTASDGTMGLKAIKDHGGITLAQNKKSATYAAMPASAIASGFVDFILDPERMPVKLLEISKSIATSGTGILPEKEEEIFKKILTLLRHRKGMDFTYYKQNTVRRRILRRMILNKVKKITSYLHYLQENPAEQDALYQDMLIPVTSFFRDPKIFNNLCESVFPSLIKNKSSDGNIRIWVAGCSTGEEAYSIAICFKEYLGIKKEKIQIFATDLSEPAIIKARAGIYSKADAETVSPGRLKEYFTPVQGGYQVNQDMRDMCVFAVHNFLKDPPFSRIDFISCRNVLIYMDSYLQKKALTTFHYALNPLGLLLLGKSENTIGITDLFITNNKSEKIFIRKDVASKMAPVLPGKIEKVNPRIKATLNKETIRADFQKIADEEILKEHTPAAVVVNESLDIVHYRGDTSLYLKQSPGKPTHNLIKMAKMGLAFELRSLVHKVKKTAAEKKGKKSIKKENIPFVLNRHTCSISLEVKLLPHTIEPYYLILFTQQVTSTNKSSVIKSSSVKDKEDYIAHIQRLEKELQMLREDMHSITEEQEASNEELQSTNEELLSSNEEMQSLNEELETSKEELQSTIEELTVVNQEMITLNEQLAIEKKAAEEARKKVEASEKQFRQLANSLPPLVWQTDPQGNQTYASKRWKEFTGLDPKNADSFEKMVHPDDLAGIVKAWTNSLSTGTTYRHEVRLRSKKGKYHWFQVHGEPLYNDKKEIEKWVGAFTDVTERKLAEQKSIESEQYFRRLTDTVPSMIWITEIDGYCSYLNKHWYEYTGQTKKEGEGFGWLTATHPDDAAAAGEAFIKANTEQKPFNHVYRLKTKNGEYRWAIDQGTPKYSATGTYEGMIGTVVDIHEEKLAADKIKESEALLQGQQRLYEAVTQNTPDLVYVFDLNYRFTYANEALLTMWGRTKQEAFGKSLLELGYEPWQAEMHEREIDEIIATKKTIRAEVAFPHATLGRRIHDYILSPVINEKGEVEAITGTTRDITEIKQSEEILRESEEKFSTLADNMENLAWLADAEGSIYWYNKRWLEYTGLTLEEMKGWGWQKVHHPDHIDRILEISKKMWHVNETFELTFPLRRHDGEYRWFLTRGYPVADEEGKIIRWIGTNTDITEQKKAEEQFRELADQAPMWVWLTDKEINVLYANPEVLKFIDISHYTEFTGHIWEQKVHPEDIAHVYQSFADATAQQQPFSFEFRVRNASTETYEWFYIKGVPRYEENHFAGFIGTGININEQKNSLSQIEYRKALLEAHNEASLDGILLVDAQGKILSFNHKFIEIWNMPQHIVDAKDDEAALSFAMAQLVNPQQFIEKVKWLYAHPTEISADILEYKDGKIVERLGYPVVAKDGSYYAWSWAFRDITAHTLAQRKIQDSEKQLRKTKEHFEIATTAAEVGTWSLDLSSQTIEWSALHKKMWGYDEHRSDLKYEDWHTVIFQEDKESAFAEVKKALITKTLYEASYRIKRPDTGEIRWIRSTGQYFYNEAGEPVTLTGVSIDITQEKKAEIALKESEKRFRLLADSMPQHVWTADAAGNLNYYNQSVFDYSGLSLEQLIKDGWLQIVHPDDREENIRQWMESVTDGIDFLFEHRFRRHDGEYRWQLSRAVPQRDAQGNITMWVGSSTEIQKIKEEEKRKDDFLKMVSHELKTPVTSIKGYVQLVLSMMKEKRETPADFLQTPLQRIESQVGRLGRLISEMLDLSRLDTGKLELQKEIFSLNELVAETVQDIGFTNSTHHINIANNFTATINADKNRIGQVLINLVNNAIKYSPDNNRVDISIDAAENNTVSISVKDYGIGIDKEHQQKIFQRFYRAGGESEQTYSGFGIGLYIANEIVLRHEGVIGVKSEKDEGSNFIFTLPLIQV